MKIFTVRGPALRCLITLALLSSIYHKALAEDAASSSSSLNTEPIVLDKVAITSIRERVDMYQAKVDDLFDGLRVEKKIRYSTIILKSYDTSKFDLVEALIAKKKYRETIAKGHTFFCNYAAINVEMPVYFELYDEIRNSSSALPGRKGSMYFFKTKRIQLRGGTDRTKMITTTICHTAGAALSGFIAPENEKIIEEMGKKKKDYEFVKAVNFEVSLQDLNRYHAMLSDGRPIMNPLDAVKAIVSMGERLKKPMVQGILARNHFDYKPEDLDKVLSSAAYKNDGEDLPDGNGGVHISPFTLAKGLVRRAQSNSGIETVNTEPALELLSGKAYEDYLERILIEAPGHI